MYCTSKAALFMLGQILKNELAKQGIWFGTVIPGNVDTPMQAEIRAIDPEIMPMVEQWRQYKEKCALIEPEFISQFLKWLLLDVHVAQLGVREWNI
jgi:NAD(P)-dependent dehydrogenase (short-subunit alcohol dehydrogenase family)